MTTSTDLAGQRFGRLTCLAVVGKTKQYDVLWECRCTCGQETIVRQGALISGHTNSCGCLQRDKARALHLRHGDAPKGNPERLYRVWRAMKRRCLQKADYSYASYGGRGISLCAAWMEYKPFRFWAIMNGYRIGLTLDRIDNDGNYEPGNCRWVTPQQQSENKRSTLRLEYRGQTKTVTEWARLLGLPLRVLHLRIQRGWSNRRILEQPVRRYDAPRKASAA